MNEFLNAEELISLIGYSRRARQAAWLKERGIAHRLDRNRIIASRVHVRSWLEGKAFHASGGLRLDLVR
uniref:DUF4224 domain-containing protein n=1 Tax=Rhodoferax sp. GW822-FHT02A01 TaxID=3141537 RepID=UPI00406CB9E3